VSVAGLDISLLGSADRERVYSGVFLSGGGSPAISERFGSDVKTIGPAIEEKFMSVFIRARKSDSADS